MRGFPVKFCWNRALGAYFNQDRMTVTEVAGTPGGTVMLGSYQCRIDQEGPGAALRRLLEERLTARQRRRVTVCLGIGAEQTFFTTRPFNPEGQQEGPSAMQMLTASGAAGAWEADQALADFVQAKMVGRLVCSLAACRRELGEQLRSALEAAGVRRYRLEPAPWSLLDAVERKGKLPRKWKLAVHVLLEPAHSVSPAAESPGDKPESPPAQSPAQADPAAQSPAQIPLPPRSPAQAAPAAQTGGLALLTSEGQPVLWRRFTMPAGQEALAVASAVRSLLVHAVQALGIRNVGGIILHGGGGQDLAGRVTDESGMEAVAAEGEGLTDELFSLGLALSARKPKPRSMDLLRSLRPPPTLRDIFPWKLASFLCLLCGAMALMMLDKSYGLAQDCDRLRRQNATHKWAAKEKTPAIDGERKRLAMEVGAVAKFLGSRLVWGDYLRDLPTRLPPNACLSNVWGACEMKDTSKKKETQRKTNKSLTLRGMTKFPPRTAGAESSSAPKEIDAFLDSLRSVDLLKRDFPLVSLAEIKWKKEEGGDIASFTIVALPKDKQDAGEEVEEKPAKPGGH